MYKRQVQGQTINGVVPNFDNIADGKYPVSRPLFVYIKKAHVGVIPGIKEFIAEYTSEKAVSYTHLDVYKRQGQGGADSPVYRAARFAGGRCAG